MALSASRAFRVFAEATIAPDVPDGSGNTRPMKILVELLRIKLGFPREVFELAVSPVIKGCEQFVQLLPPSESRAQGDPEDLLARALCVATRALDYRRGQILPRGAAPEVIGAQAHRWTYAVFVAAMFCAVCQNSLDGPEGVALPLLYQLVPPLVLEWLAADPALMRELQAFLSEMSSAQAGAISDLVLRAVTEPVSCDQRPSVDLQGVKAEAGAEPEDLEDGDEEHRAPDQTILTSTPVFAQAPDAAHRFIGWVQEGISDGTLRVNQAGALVHFVEEGMLLVSPRIFREFAKCFVEVGGAGSSTAPAPVEPDIGKWIQRQFLRAGLHLRADKGVNILSYQVMRGDRAVSRLSGVVIRNPGQFVTPVPPINPLLVRLIEAPGGV